MLHGIGNPLMDVIVRTSEEAPEKVGAVPGSMNLVEYDQQQAAKGLGTVVRQLPGGSCANTIRGTGWLIRAVGSTAKLSYSGAVGTDREGGAFSALLDTEGIDPALASKRTPTGSSVIIVTPDSQRTMFTYLGACRDYDAGDLNLPLIRSARILHTTGYMWDTPNQEAAARRASEVARGANTLVSFDVADPFVANRYRDSLMEWIPGNVQLLFANGEELRALTGENGPDEAVLAAAERLAPTVVMKIGADGCHVLHRGVTTTVPAHPATRFDTTGAGDAFAGGYLFGLVQKWSAVECATVANILAAGIVSVDGCNYDALDEAEVRASIQAAIDR